MRKLALLLPLLVLLLACNKDKQQLKNTTWKAESVKVHTDSTWQYPVNDSWPNDFILRFKKNNGYGCMGCGGKVVFLTNQKINFKTPSCLAIGISDFASECRDMLWQQITHYELSDNKLILKGKNGEIMNLIKIE